MKVQNGMGGPQNPEPRNPEPRNSGTLEPRNLGRVTVLPSADGGRYPQGHSVVIRGTEETVLVDPSLSVSADPPAGIDRLLISHAHEDHLAGVWRYPGVPIHAHAADLAGVQSLDGLMAVYGLPPAIETPWREAVVERFHYVARPDAVAFRDGDVFDLGSATVRVIHLPGHTSGHSALLVEPDGVLLLADIDLSGFGPYYGDASSSLDAFERSLVRCRDLEARWYVTFHHKGVIDGRAAFLALLTEYEQVIQRREQALVAWLAEPRSLDDIVAHRFVYRPHVKLLFAEAVERRSAELHLARLLQRGDISEVDPGRYCRT